MTDRTEHCRRIGAMGGAVTAQKYGTHHMRTIGKAGAQVTMQRYGVAFFQGIVGGKGWDGRKRAELRQDLALGRLLAERYG